MLEKILVGDLFTVLMIFSRIGSGLMIMPGFAEAYVNFRTRLLLALSFSVVLAPIMQPHMPTLPNSPLVLTYLLGGEIIIGIAIGTVCRMLVASLHVAGMIYSAQAGLSMATQFDMTQSTQGTLMGNLLSMTGVVFLFTSDLHYTMLRGMVDSYNLFSPGMTPPIHDFAQYFSMLVGKIFMVGVKLSAPAIVMGLLLYLGVGILARLMPQMQVFFIIQSPQVLLGIFLLMAMFTSILLEFSDFFRTSFALFLGNV